ncbi:MAG: hypothetical protein SH850_13500 [Planctomycetaceae bacterium]|nr:hypothetical protein [Planctomycetaceae bacterium]
MAKRCAFILAGLMVATSAIGCCCGMGGYRGGGGACSPCGQGGPAYYPPGGGAYNQGYGSTAFVGDGSMMAAAPGMPGTTYTTTALAPINSLPTY